ncbi:MAG: FAD-dependent oxidoreductase, partial [Actinomycetota bacterium]|nr:FAD-dependent oxidoreductase [Actinomycetota bacterium]
AEQVTGDDGGVRLVLDDGATIDADLLLVAAGRTPNTDRMNLGAGGVDTHDDGRIVADRYGRTSADGVWTLGDISTGHPLKHVANHEAAVVGDNLTTSGELRRVDEDLVPAAVFASPQIGTVGRTEQQCRDDRLSYAVSVLPYSDVAYGWALEDETGFCKIIAETGTGRLLGAHLMGPQASTLVQQLVQAMALDVPARRMACLQHWIHPALPEVIENALRNLEL